MSEGFKNFAPKAEAADERKELELTPEDEALIKRVMEEVQIPDQVTSEVAVPKVDEPLHRARTDAEVVAFAQTGIDPHQLNKTEVKPPAAVEEAAERFDKAA